MDDELASRLSRYAPSRTYLLEALHDAQELFGGWLPRPAVEQIATYLGVPVADVYGVIEFYEMFRAEPVGRKLIRVCQDGPCAVAGADELTERTLPAARHPPRRDHSRRRGYAGNGALPGAVRSRAGGPRQSRAMRARHRRDAARRPARSGATQDRRPGQGGAVGCRHRRSGQPGRLPRPGRHGGVAQGARRDDAGASHRRGEGQQAAGPRRRGLLGRAEVAVRRQQPAAALHHLQRGRERAGRVQRPGADGRRSVPHHRGAADRQLCDRRGAGVHLRARGASAGLRALQPCRACAGGCRLHVPRRPRRAASRARSRCAAARARTSAAKRRR